MRIGIKVPNELLSRLEPLKPELNISQVCREALEAKAQSHERMQARLNDPGVQKAVARIWKQEKEFHAAIAFDWEMLGYEDAATWVKAATLDDWDDLLELIDWHKENKAPEWKIFPPVIAGVNTIAERSGQLSDSIRKMEQREPAFGRWLWQKRGASGYMPDERAYMIGWLSYTKAVWQLVRQREMEYLEEQERQLHEARRNRPAPEAPQHLLPDIQPQATAATQPYRMVPHHAGFAPGVDPEKLNHLLDQLDIEDYLSKQGPAQ